MENKTNKQKAGKNKSITCTVYPPVVVTILCTNTPAFCRQLTGKPPRLDPDDSLPGAEPADTCRGIMGTGVDWTGRTLATGFSSVQGDGRLGRICFSLVPDFIQS